MPQMLLLLPRLLVLPLLGPSPLLAQALTTLPVTLLANVSHRSNAVALVNVSNVPPQAAWLHIKPTTSSSAPPTSAKGWWHPVLRLTTRAGVQELPFTAACEFESGCRASQHKYSYTVQAWSDRNDLGDPSSTATLLASSAPLDFIFDDAGFAHGLRFTNFTATEHQPGHVTISCLPTNATLYNMASQIAWFGFRVVAERSSALPMFRIDEDLLDAVYSTRLVSPPRVSISLSLPGVYFVGMYGAFNGDMGGADRPKLGVRTYSQFPTAADNVAGSFQPFAIVVPWSNGTVPPLPARFAGPHYQTQPIPGDMRLALRRSSATIFDGGTWYLPNVKGPAGFGVLLPGPHCVELELPLGMWPQPSLRGFYVVSNASALSGGGTVASGYQRVRLTNNATNPNEWGFLNWDVKLRMTVAPALNGATFPKSKARAYTGLENQARSDNWQTLALTVRALEPLPAGLPSRLRTKFCWAGWQEFGRDTMEAVAMWRRLGFNTIPNDGIVSTRGTLSPTQRTGSTWQGLSYGVMMSAFSGGGLAGLGSMAALKMSVAAAQIYNLSALRVSNAELPEERAKLVAAATFYSKNAPVMDLSYDGVFYRQDVEAVAAVVNYTRPDYLSFDVEGLPALETWCQLASQSSNFHRRLQPRERYSSACLRIAQGWLGHVVDSARKVMRGSATSLQPALYNGLAMYQLGFEMTTWPMLNAMGFSDEPSYYDFMNSLDRLGAKTRAERLTVGHSNSTLLLPWLSPGQTTADGGAPPEVDDPGIAMFNALLQVFANGASGFNVCESMPIAMQAAPIRVQAIHTKTTEDVASFF
eukprot:SAG11_NODE_362_length_10182_cov_9.886641_10_plen_813_part_00